MRRLLKLAKRLISRHTWKLSIEAVKWQLLRRLGKNKLMPKFKDALTRSERRKLLTKRGAFASESLTPREMRSSVGLLSHALGTLI